MPDSAPSLLRAPCLQGLLQGCFQSVQPLGPGNLACIRVYSHVTAMHQGKVQNAKRFNRDELRRIQQERVGQVYMGQVMTGDWDGDACILYKNEYAHHYTNLLYFFDQKFVTCDAAGHANFLVTLGRWKSKTCEHFCVTGPKNRFFFPPVDSHVVPHKAR
jgi:hypothetical protein